MPPKEHSSLAAGAAPFTPGNASSSLAPGAAPFMPHAPTACRYFAAGFCSRGDSCTFAHEHAPPGEAARRGGSRAPPRSPPARQLAVLLEAVLRPVEDGGNETVECRVFGRQRTVFSPGGLVVCLLPVTDAVRVFVGNLPADASEADVGAALRAAAVAGGCTTGRPASPQLHAAPSPLTRPPPHPKRLIAVPPTRVATAHSPSTTHPPHHSSAPRPPADAVTFTLHAPKAPTAGPASPSPAAPPAAPRKHAHRAPVGAAAAPVAPAPTSRQTAVATFLSPAAARAAVGRLHGSFFHPGGRLSTSERSPSALTCHLMGAAGAPHGSAQGGVQSTAVRLQWYAPSRVAWAQFKGRADAERAASTCNGRRLKGSVIQCKFQQPPQSSYRGPGRAAPQPDHFTVWVGSLGEGATQSDIKAMFKHTDGASPYEVTWAALPFTDARAPGLVRAALERFGPVASFDMQQAAGGGRGGGGGGRGGSGRGGGSGDGLSPLNNKRRAIAKFAAPDAAARAVAELHDRPLPALGGMKILATPLFSAKLTVLKPLNCAFKGQPASVLAACQIQREEQRSAGTGSGVSLSVFGADDDALHSVSIWLTSSDAQGAASVKAVLDDILAGSRLMAPPATVGAGGAGADGVEAAAAGARPPGGSAMQQQQPAWSDKLRGATGAAFLREVHASTGAFVYRDERRRELRLHVEPGACAAARAAVMAHLTALQAQHHSLPLPAGVLQALLRRKGAVKAMRIAVGARSASLRLTPPPARLLLVGGPAVLDKARMLVERLSAEAAAVLLAGGGSGGGAGARGGDEAPTCPVYFCPVEPDDNLQLCCGHAYCTACFTEFAAQARRGGGANFPMACVAEACGQRVRLQELALVLPPDAMGELYAAALEDHVNRNPGELQGCITPDCRGIYALPRGDDGERTATCGECSVVVCSACRVEEHEGPSCAAYKQSRGVKGLDLAFRAWKDAHDVRACPRCAADIEKNEGCNHMTCKCGAHICWFCMQAFDASGPCYAHMQSKHSSFY
ncbi:hypothetical protein FOA52_005377 [Chlamydomonas sp. UWO 241]|nr:hypothetical protein FOA52_005377 [Chlamydomonas sp. UWO 241]